MIPTSFLLAREFARRLPDGVDIFRLPKPAPAASPPHPLERVLTLIAQPPPAHPSRRG